MLEANEVDLDEPLEDEDLGFDLDALEGDDDELDLDALEGDDELDLDEADDDFGVLDDE